MIIIRLTGGLGNQLFQYAFARSLSYNLDTELFLDISMFSHDEMRKHVVFGLHAYNIKGMIGHYPYVDKTSIGINHNKKQPLEKIVEGLPFPESIFEYGIIEDIDINLPAYFQGWFHNQIKDEKTSYITENFFKLNSELIHEDLKYCRPLSDESQKLSLDIKNHDSIALHIRHGDYGDYPKFGFCTVEYYQQAIELIAKKLENPKFYIFTEDPDWVGYNLNINYPFEVIRFSEKTNTTGRGYSELLKIMSLCDHFIIANSTYSWWAAFLGENPDKTIISPEPWFQDRSILKTDTIDNVNTISLKNDYNALFDNSKNVLYELDRKDMGLKNRILKRNFLELKNNDDIILKDISPKSPESKVIIQFNLETNCFNGLKVYYKTDKHKKYLEKNSLDMYYYRDEQLTHSLILPKNVELSEIKIKPFILAKNSEDTIKIHSITVKEITE